jgi:hypothetical protein
MQQQQQGAWSGDSGIQLVGARGRDGGGGKAWKSGRWGERPAAFVKDLTARIPAGTYGWWPLSIRVPPGTSVGEAAGNYLPRRPLMLTMFILMRGSRGTHSEKYSVHKNYMVYVLGR